MSEYVYAGLTSQTIDIFLQDSSSATGEGLIGLAYNTAGLVASYRKGATGSRAALSLATQTVGGAWASGGFVEIDATNMPGIYRLDIPNTIVDTEGFVTLYFHGATNLLVTPLRVDCRALPVDVKKIAADAQSATDLKDFADTGYDPATHKVQGVAIVDTTTTNTDMRGTDNAMLATSYSAPPSAATISTQVASDLTTAHGVGSWVTATGFATSTNVTDARDAILDDLAGGVVLDTATSTKIDSILEDTGTTLPGLIGGIPKVGSTHRYTQVAQTSTTTDVSIGEAT